MVNLLNIDKNVKTVKGQKYGYMTGILYLAPSDLSGKNVCPTAKLAGCEKGCLNTAGQGVFNNVQEARIRKTKLFHDNQNYFMNLLKDDIQQLINKAYKKQLIPVVRLNGTSDITWEKVLLEGKTLMDWFPELTFYDYTKLNNRKPPSNYDLTFSYSGRPEYSRFVKQALDQGMRIATVFADRYALPKQFLGREVIHGDDHDLRFLEPKEAVVALYAKGRARKDFDGFVVRTL